MRSEILWAAHYGSLFATHQSTKQLNFEADGCIWMSDFALAKVSVFSNLPIVYGEMVLCFIFPTSRDLHANTFRELSEVYADLIRHAGFHFPTTGNFTLCSSWAVLTALLWLHCQLLLSCGVALDMIVERCQKFGGLTLGRKPKTNTQQKKHNILQIQGPMEMKWNCLCY